MEFTIQYLMDESDAWVWRVRIDGQPSGAFASFPSAAAMGIADAGDQWGLPDTAPFASLAP